MKAELQQLVGKFPVPAGDGKLASPNEREMDEAVNQLATLGREAVVGLVNMLVNPSQGGDTQARHALHALVTHVAGLVSAEQRYEVTQALVSTLDGERPPEVKSFVIGQVQMCGGEAAAEALGKLLVNERLCESAAQALLAIGGTASVFRQALANAQGKATRLPIVQALGELRDAEAAAALRETARDADREVRLAALWGLARIGQAADVDLLTSAANATGYERIQATKSCLLLAETLLAARDKQPAARIYQHLRDSRDESEAYVRQAAERGLAAVR